MSICYHRNTRAEQLLLFPADTTHIIIFCLVDDHNDYEIYTYTYDDIITRVCVYAQTFISAIKSGGVVLGRRAGRLTHIFTNEIAEGR